MITRVQYETLIRVSDKYPLIVKVERGTYKFEHATESAIRRLVELGALKPAITGELGDYTITYVPTEKARAIISEYEDGKAKERQARGGRR